MQKYLLFTFYSGRALGGMGDFLDTFPSVEESLENILPESGRYYQIVDRQTLAVVKEGLAAYKNFAASEFQRL